MANCYLCACNEANCSGIKIRGFQVVINSNVIIMKKVILSTLFVFSILFVAAQAKYTGYLYTEQTGSKEAFQYSISTRFSNGAFQTIYKIYKPGASKNRYTITASHFKNDKKIIVEVNDEQYLLSVMNGKEEVEYETGKLQLFGIRGDLGFFDKLAPNQLAVQFVSSRFEYVRVINFLGSYSDNIFQFFLFNKNDKVSEPKESILDSNRSKLSQAKYTVQVESNTSQQPVQKNVVMLTDYTIIKNVYTPTDLIKTFGDRNVQVRDAYDREGTLRGKEYVLYPNTKNEVVVSFENIKSNSITIKNKNSDWKFPYDFYVGMPLKKVIAANGKDFKFYGFEWDYSGMLASWEKGKLEGEGVSIMLATSVEINGANSSIYDKFMGTEQYSTSNPQLEGLGLVVEEITFWNEKKDGTVQ